MTQSLDHAVQRPKFSVAVNSKKYQDLIQSTLRDPERARRFTASITSAVAVNPALQDCDAGTVLAGALLGESLNLSPSPQLGQYYLVPFKKKAKYDRSGNLLSPETTVASFVIGYKGFIQLALRSGQYRDMDAIEIKQGEFRGRDRRTGCPIFEFIEDDDKREELPTVGYMAFLEYLNGFRKVIYWTKNKMMTHADTYSSAFSAIKYQDLQAGRIPERDLWKFSSFWYKNFDVMAKKTMIRQLISKWGIMSIDMQIAFAHDDAVNTISESDNRIIAATIEAGQALVPPDAEPVQSEMPEIGAPQETPSVNMEPEAVDLSAL